MRNLDPGKLSSALTENMRYLENILNQTFNFDHDILSNVGIDDHHVKYTDAEVDTIVATHDAITSAHHTKYTDAEAIAAVGLEGVWTTWVPTYNNFTIGAGTVVARYVEIGDSVIAQFSLTFAGDTTIDGSSPDVSLPVTANGSGFSVLPGTTAIAYESGGGLRFCTSYLKSTTVAAIFPQAIVAGYLQAATVSATVPFTWGTGDVYAFTIIYEKA